MRRPRSIFVRPYWDVPEAQVEGLAAGPRGRLPPPAEPAGVLLNRDWPEDDVAPPAAGERKAEGRLDSAAPQHLCADDEEREPVEHCPLVVARDERPHPGLHFLRPKATDRLDTGATSDRSSACATKSPSGNR